MRGKSTKIWKILKLLKIIEKLNISQNIGKILNCKVLEKIQEILKMLKNPKEFQRSWKIEKLQEIF